MKQDTITIGMDAEKLRALKRYMGKKSADLERELQDQLQKLYEKFVPGSVREYIDEGDEETPVIPEQPKKQKEKNGTPAEKTSPPGKDSHKPDEISG